MAITRTTFHDVILHLQDSEFGIAQDAQQTILKRAVRMAYRDVRLKLQVEYFEAPYNFFLNAAYGSADASDGTVTFDYTGGSSELLCTISAGTVPTWAEYGVLRTGGENYTINKRLSSTTFTLNSDSNPGEDVAATTDWTIYRDTYPLPNDFLAFPTLREHGNFLSQAFVTPDQWHQYQSIPYFSSPPFRWTVMANPERGGQGKYVIRVVGWPTDDYRASIMYRKLATEPVLAGVETAATAGTIAVSAGSRTVTGADTTFTAGMVGSVLRIGTASNTPTGNDGLYPFAEEHIIETFTSATEVILATDVAADASGVKYRVSDLLDADQAMTNAILIGSEYFLGTLQHKEARNTAIRYREALLEAKAAQNHNSAVTNVMRRDGEEEGIPWPYPPAGS